MQGYDGEKITVVRTAPSGGVITDAGYVIGDEFLVACETAAAGVDAVFVRVGCCRMIPKTTGQTNVKGAKAYFNATSGKTENTASATNYLIGTFEVAAGSSDTESSVILPGAPVSVGGVPGAVTMGLIHNDQMRNSTNIAQSLADATEEVIDLEDVELAGDVTYAAGTTSLATIPVGGTGLYAIVYGATFAAGAGTYNRLMIKINGVIRTSDEETPDNANPIEVVGNTMLRLAAGDTVGLYAQQDSGGALDVTAARLGIQRLQ